MHSTGLRLPVHLLSGKRMHGYDERRSELRKMRQRVHRGADLQLRRVHLHERDMWLCAARERVRERMCHAVLVLPRPAYFELAGGHLPPDGTQCLPAVRLHELPSPGHELRDGPFLRQLDGLLAHQRLCRLRPDIYFVPRRARANESARRKAHRLYERGLPNTVSDAPTAYSGACSRTITGMTRLARPA